MWILYYFIYLFGFCFLFIRASFSQWTCDTFNMINCLHGSVCILSVLNIGLIYAAICFIGIGPQVLLQWGRKQQKSRGAYKLARWVGGAKGHFTWQLDGSGGVLPQKIWDFRCYKMLSEAFLGQFSINYLCKYLSGSKVIADVKNLLVLVLIMFMYLYQNLSTSHLALVNLPIQGINVIKQNSKFVLYHFMSNLK